MQAVSVAGQAVSLVVGVKATPGWKVLVFCMELP